MSLEDEIREIVHEEQRRLDEERPRVRNLDDVIHAARMLGLDGVANAVEFTVRDNANSAAIIAVLAGTIADPQFPEWLALHKPGSTLVTLDGRMVEYTVLSIEVFDAGRIGAKMAYGDGRFMHATFDQWRAGTHRFAPQGRSPSNVPPTWIQTNQMVPDNDDPVMVLMNDGEVGVLRFVVRSWMTVSIGPRGIYDQSDPVAWMPIVVPPAPEAIRLRWETSK